MQQAQRQFEEEDLDRAKQELIANIAWGQQPESAMGALAEGIKEFADSIGWCLSCNRKREADVRRTGQIVIENSIKNSKSIPTK